jgi:UDP-N-acetylmuramyl pentapeptide synthase
MSQRMAVGKHLAKKYKLIAVIRHWVVLLFLYYIKFWAQIALRFTKAYIIGIAGAVGKSTTRNALSVILQNKAPTIVVEGNSQTGVPLGLLGFEYQLYSLRQYFIILVTAPFRILYLRRAHFIVVELGIDGPTRPQNMEYLLSIIKPQCGILLSESLAHSEQYECILPTEKKDMDTAAKEQFFIDYQLKDDSLLIQTKQTTTAIIDATDSNVYKHAASLLSKSHIYSVGTEDHHDIVVHYHELQPQSTRFDFSVHTHQKKAFISLTFDKMMLPHETGGSLGAAILAAIHVGIEPEEIEHILNTSMRFPPGRGTIFSGKHNTRLIDSSYNASPQSVLAFLKAAKTYKKTLKKRTLFVLGDMKELGAFTEYGHVQVAHALVDAVDDILLIGPLTQRYILPYCERNKKDFKSVIWFPTIQALAAHLQTHAPPEAYIFFKGSQTLEEAVKSMLLNPEDASLLCRQDSFWEQSKKKLHLWIQLTSQ